MSDSEEEEIPSSSHPRMGRPRVSFSGEIMGGLSLPPDGNGNINSAFTSEDCPNKPVETTTADNSSEIVEMEEIPRPQLNRRRVSVTASGDAVIVRGAEKSYKAGTPVLNGLNMTVPCGSIYGLLGSSGCGKTTVLSCIVGQRKLNRGNIWIFGKRPGTKSIGVPGKNIGYMPQDISLYSEFSIDETLTYFGTLSGMTKEKIKSSKKFLIKLLHLPVESRIVATLSGGQSRRVSFAASLLHDPELLILDEPTVGVDPLLRHNIWLHLRQLVNSKRTTVLITTHYIEECRQADNIGIMRSGRLIAERQPHELFAEQGTTNLETIVLNLSRKDTQAKLDPVELAKAVENSKKNRKRKNNTVSSTDDNSATDPASSSFKDPENEITKMASVMHEAEPALKDSLTRIRALAGKNFVILLRNPLLLFFVLLVSAVMVSLICISFGSDPIRMRVGLVNYEVDYHSVCSNVTRAPGECNVELLSCHYLLNVPKDSIYWRVYNTEEEAITATHKGVTWGYMVFPDDFSTKLYERMTLSGPDFIDEQVFNSSQINVRLDESNKQITAAIKKVLYDAFEDFVKIFLLDCGFDPRQANSPLVYHQPVFGKDDTDFREYIAPGITPALMFFYPIITSSVRFIKEKKNGVLDRSMVGGVRTWEIMVAYSISEFFVLLCQSILNYLILTLVFQIQILGSHVLVILIFLLSGYGGVSMGFLLGSICSEEIQAAIIAMAAFFPNFILSGILWPVEGMAEVLQYFVQILPCTLTGEAIRSITSRGWEFTHPNVWPAFVILVGYIFGYFLLTVIFHVIFKR